MTLEGYLMIEGPDKLFLQHNTDSRPVNMVMCSLDNSR